MKFIHAADLHIDSPLRGLQAYEGAPSDQLRNATDRAFERLVEVAVAEQVAFVIIAGDLFDGQWQDVRTGLWTARQFRELERNGIEVFLLQGNHDAASKVRQQITWPQNVHTFSSRRPETFRLEALQVALHGQGFERQEETRDLAADYPDPIAGWFNIGVLHTSLTGSPDHDTYAPTSPDVLISKGYQYWALGHIHARSDPPISTDPYIGYSGNTQGRHIRETGPKGCLLVEVTDAEVVDVGFRSTDVLRWRRADIDVSDCDSRESLLATVERALTRIQKESPDRLTALRLELTGSTEFHSQLVDSATRDEMIAEIRNLANGADGELWVEKIRISTMPSVDIEQLLAAPDVRGELFRAIRATAENPGQLTDLAKCLETLTDKGASELHEAGIDLNDPDRLARLIRQVEQLMLARFAEVDS